MKICVKSGIKRPFIQTMAICAVALCIVAGSILFFSNIVNADTGDEVRAAKKIISVVYDDSDSMVGERWSYANYSMQALIALMNEQDELYITFMTDSGNSQEIPLNSLQSSVNRVHDKSESGNTPAKALDTAMERLEGIEEDDPSTQFWYVVMTDGEIYYGDWDGSNREDIDIQARLDSYKNKTMSNSSKLNIVYLGMVGAVPVKSDTAGNLYSYMPESDGDIVSAMRDISNKISSRLVAKNIEKVNSKEIKVTSDLPLYNISVLSQRSSAKIAKARTDELDLNVQRNISLDATDLSLGEPIESLFGNAGIINYINNGEQKIISAGTYTITFTDDVDINDIIVQFEPAISFRPQIIRNGVSLSDTSELNYGDKVSIRLVPVIPGTNEEIPADTLPDGMKIKIEYKVDGNSIASSDNGELTDVTIDEGNNAIRGTISISGFADYTREKTFNIVNIIYHWGIVVEEKDIYVPSDKKPEDYEVSGITYDRSCIKDIDFDDSNTVKFWITNEGQKLSAEDQTELNVKLEYVSMDFIPSENPGLWGFLGSKLMSGHLEGNSDGSYSLIPEVPAFFITTLFIKDGKYVAHVKVSKDDTVDSTGSFILLRNKTEDKLPWILLAILILIIYMIICSTKKKFRNQRVLFERYKLKSNGKGEKDNHYSSSTRLNNNILYILFVPSKACVKTWKGFTFTAGPEGQIYVSGKSIASKYKYCGAKNENPENFLGAIAGSLKATKNKQGKCAVGDMFLQLNKGIYMTNYKSSSDLRAENSTDIYIYRLVLKK